MELSKQQKLSAIMHTAEECGAQCILKYLFVGMEDEVKINMDQWHFDGEYFYYKETYGVKIDSITSITIKL